MKDYWSNKLIETIYLSKLIQHYRPIANLCSVSKVFERLILKRILELEAINGIKIGGNQQHGFAKNRSTLTAGPLIQSLIARALDKGEYNDGLIRLELI